jgi:hypothetical protein
MGLPVSASHNRAVLSKDAVMMRLPSGLNAALYTASEWPRNSPIGFPLSAFHSRAVVSKDAVRGHDLVELRAVKRRDIDMLMALEERLVRL